MEIQELKPINDSYVRLPFHQYFIDTSKGVGGQEDKISVEVNYKTVEYTCKDGHKHNAMYFVTYNSNRHVIQIYFKDTTGAKQWLSNFEFAEDYYDEFEYEGKKIRLRAHHGWAEMYQAIKWIIRNEVESLIKEHSDCEVEVIGWSLGSAMAQLCSQDLFYNFNIRSHVFTFGSVKPWYGKDEDVKNYLAVCTKECYNFYDHCDIVGSLVPLPRYFAMNHVKVKQDKWCIHKWLFKAGKYHCEYYKEELYKDIK